MGWLHVKTSQILLESQLQPLPGNSKSGNTLSPLREMISKSGHPSLKFRIDPAMQNHKKSDPYNRCKRLPISVLVSMASSMSTFKRISLVAFLCSRPLS